MNFYEQLFCRGRTTGEGMTHFERLFAAKFGGSPPPEVREYTGAVPVTITADGTPLLDYLISGNMEQNGTPTPQNPIQPSECGDLEIVGEKAGQYKIPISSANTTTPVYLGEVPTTRRIKKLVLTGEENWGMPTTSLFRLLIPGYLRSKDYTIISSHYKGLIAVSLISDIPSNSCAFLVSSSGNNYFYINDTSYNTYEDFKAYLAQQYANGTPVCVWYVIDTPTTGMVNEPIRKIGDYADTVSKEQAEVQIPTNNGSTTVDVETTLKPSEVYIKYMG